MTNTQEALGQIGHAQMLKLKRWNTPTIYNGWEAITKRERTDAILNREECRDFMPFLGTMVGRAVTVRIETTNARNPVERPKAWDEWLAHVASVPGPKIVVMQDMTSPAGLGSFWGEVSANMHRTLGCVGAIVDGAVRDVDEMANAGFKALARRLCIGHFYAWPVEWDIPVTVFGTEVEPGTLMHADKHGFIGIPAEDEGALLAAVRGMDDAECDSLIPNGRYAWGRSHAEVLSGRADAVRRYRELSARVGRGEGEW